MVERSDSMWSTGEGNGKPLQHSSLENPMNSMKSKIPDHLTYLLRNLYAGHEATVRTGHGTTDWFQIGKGVHQGCILSPCLLTSMHSTS